MDKNVPKIFIECKKITVPSEPSNILTTRGETSYAEFTWNQNVGASNYFVQISSATGEILKAFSISREAPELVSFSTQTFVELEAGTSYALSVVAGNSAGNSSESIVNFITSEWFSMWKLSQFINTS